MTQAAAAADVFPNRLSDGICSPTLSRSRARQRRCRGRGFNSRRGSIWEPDYWVKHIAIISSCSCCTEVKVKVIVISLRDQKQYDQFTRTKQEKTKSRQQQEPVRLDLLEVEAAWTEERQSKSSGQFTGESSNVFPVKSTRRPLNTKSLMLTHPRPEPSSEPKHRRNAASSFFLLVLLLESHSTYWANQLTLRLAAAIKRKAS